MMPALIIAGTILFIVIIIFVSHRLSQQRTEALRKAAEALNFTFIHPVDDGFLKALGSFHLFSQGYSKKISNLMRGAALGVDVTIFDYRYTTGSGKSSHTWNQTVIMFQSETMNLPPFLLRPENVFHKIGQAFGAEDIDFSDHPNFSKKYLLRSTEEDACREVFTESILGYYENHLKCSTENRGDTLLHYRVSRQVRPEEIPSFLEEGARLLTLFHPTV